MTIEQVLRVFAQSILSKSKALTSPQLTENQQKRIRDSITADIRACGGLLFPEQRLPEVSKAAHEMAERLGVPIGEMTWRNQTKHDAGRKVFHWEHVDTISGIQEACEQADSEDAV